MLKVMQDSSHLYDVNHTVYVNMHHRPVFLFFF